MHYMRYSDLQYATYVTDSTTNRPEQRRFDLRITREPIHIYVAETGNVKGLPLEFYVSTFYADGRPAQSSVRVYEFPVNVPRFRPGTPDKWRIARADHSHESLRCRKSVGSTVGKQRAAVHGGR